MVCNFPEKHDSSTGTKSRFSRMISTGDQIENPPFREKTRCELTVFLLIPSTLGLFLIHSGRSTHTHTQAKRHSSSAMFLDLVRGEGKKVSKQQDSRRVRGLVYDARARAPVKR